MDAEETPEVVALRDQVATKQQKINTQEGNIATLQEMVNTMRATLAAQGLQVDPHGKVPLSQPVGMPSIHPARVLLVNPKDVLLEHPTDRAEDPSADMPQTQLVGVRIPLRPQDLCKGKVGKGAVL